MVSNFSMSRFPRESKGEALSWDNVVSGSPSLGYVVATHQGIRTAHPDGTVLTAYTALGTADNAAKRRGLAKAPVAERLGLACQDLDAAYGADWRRWCTGAELTVHGHAMPVPSPGFLDEPIAARARQALKDKQSLLFAHSDLSGYSVFDEASFWGVQTAKSLLG